MDSCVADADNADIVHPAVEFGVGTRVFLTHWLTFRADLRNYVYPLNVGKDHALTFPSALLLTFGIGIHLPLDFDYSSEIIGEKG